MGNCHRSLLVLGRNLEALAEEDDEEEMEEHQEKDVSHCPMTSKYGPSLSKAQWIHPLVVKKSHFNKNKGSAVVQW